MTSLTSHDAPVARSLDDLRGLNVLLVEDSWNVGAAVKDILELLGADVAGPAATKAEAERLLAERSPDIALVDFHLRGGELADGLITLLHAQGVPVIVTSGSCEFSPPGWRSQLSWDRTRCALRTFVVDRLADVVLIADVDPPAQVGSHCKQLPVQAAQPKQVMPNHTPPQPQAPPQPLQP